MKKKLSKVKTKAKPKQKATKHATGLIGRKKAFLMHCGNTNCGTKYWRLPEQITKPEKCGVCGHEGKLEHVEK